MSTRIYGILWIIYLAVAGGALLIEGLDALTVMIVCAAGLCLLLTGIVSLGPYFRKKVTTLPLPSWVDVDPSCRPVGRPAKKKAHFPMALRYH